MIIIYYAKCELFKSVLYLLTLCNSEWCINSSRSLYSCNLGCVWKLLSAFSKSHDIKSYSRSNDLLISKSMYVSPISNDSVDKIDSSSQVVILFFLYCSNISNTNAPHRKSVSVSMRLVKPSPFNVRYNCSYILP